MDKFSTMFELDSRIASVLDSLPEDVVLDEVLEAQLDALLMERVDMVDNVVKAIDNHSSMEEMFRTQAMRLSNRASYHSHRTEILRNYLRSSMRRLEEKKVQTSTRTVLRYEGPEKIDHVDVENLPDEFVSRVPKKAEILKKYKETGELPEGTTVTRSEVLAIKMR